MAGGKTSNHAGIAAAYRHMLAGNWRSAASAWEQVGCPFERALALSAGDSSAQRRALEIFEKLGARPAVRMLRESLQAHGQKGLPRRPHASTLQNPAGLTAREMEILALLAQGMSNLVRSEERRVGKE